MKYTGMLLGWAGMLVVAGAAGCNSVHFLDQAYEPDRADYGMTPIAVEPDAPPTPHIRLVNPDPSGGAVETVVRGTWEFTTPPTVTRVERRNDTMMQYALYFGRPEPTDKPFVVITVTQDSRGLAETDAETYRVSATRTYLLHGNPVQEWSGNTKTGEGFCELMVRRPGDEAGRHDVCHAMAIARTADERTLALEILGSLEWKAQ